VMTEHDFRYGARERDAGAAEPLQPEFLNRVDDYVDLSGRLGTAQMGADIGACG